MRTLFLKIQMSIDTNHTGCKNCPYPTMGFGGHLQDTFAKIVKLNLVEIPLFELSMMDHFRETGSLRLRQDAITKVNIYATPIVLLNLNLNAPCVFLRILRMLSFLVCVLSNVCRREARSAGCWHSIAAGLMMSQRSAAMPTYEVCHQQRPGEKRCF